MRIKVGNGLLPLNLLVVTLIVAIIFSPSNVLRIVLGLPFLLFLPGYVLVLALFPKKEGMGTVERVALSFGMSIAVVPLIGLILNYTAWGITLESTLYSMAAFIFILSIIAWFRQKRLTEEGRFSIQLRLTIPGWEGGIWDKTLSVILIVSILGALGMLGYVIAKPKVGERFTEFYILGMEGKAIDYPEELVVGKEGKVMVGIINREYETASYRIEVRINGIEVNEVGTIVLEHEEEWELEISFAPTVSGDNQKVEFLLYKEGQTEAYEALHLWVDVKD
ncbi:MAG TPA: DUF1616 domain-containing protein [Dehalococcoidia bacterium]|nr:DUF1616 domain-containing protein [Dehalococcoidia bacterium]